MKRSLPAGLWLGLSVALAVSAENVPEYNARVWQSDEGLPVDAVWTVAQTRDGFLWVGSRGGLARFDGERFAIFDPSNVPEMQSKNVTGVQTTSDGSLWAATDSGLVRFKGGHFIRYSKTDGLAGDACIGSILEDADGRIWIGTLQGLSRFEHEKFTTIYDGVVRGICQDFSKNLWFATTNGIDCWSNGNFVLHLGKSDGLSEPNLRAIYCTPDGAILAGTGAEEVSEIVGGKLRPIVSRNGPNYNLVTVLHQDRRGTLWAGTFSGLNRIVNGKFIPELNADGLPYGAVMDILEDREGNLWACAKDGLLRLKPNRVLCYTQKQGLANDNVSSVLENHAGTMYIATWGGGLNRLRDGIITAYTNKNSFPALGLGMCQDSAGHFWVGTDFHRGLYELDEDEMRHFTDQKNGALIPPIRVIIEDRKKNLWLGTSDGLLQIRDGQVQASTLDDELKTNTIRALCEDHAGDLWIGTQAGLFHERDGVCTRYTATNGLAHDFVLEIFEDKENTLWLGSYGGGLTHFHNGVFTSYTTRQGLFSDNISAITEDNNGWLWLGSERGIFRINRKNLVELDHGVTPAIRCVPYGKTDGMINKVCNAVAKPSVWKSRDGRIWFATIKGLCVVDPTQTILPEAPPPPVVIEAALTERESVADPQEQPSPIHFHPGRGELEFHYAALAFRAPEENRYKYKLDRVDSDWVDADKGRIARYNNIYPGKYRFHVIACNSDGVWNRTGAEVAVIMEPHCWQTWWFQPACFAVVAGALAVIYRIVLLRRREIDRLRLRIAADLHDELGGNLASIALLSQLGEKSRDKAGPIELSEINRIALLTVSGIRDIVWFINPDYDTMTQMVSRMRDVASQMLIGIDFKFISPDEPGAGKLSPDFRRNFFLIFKEILHNIVKHSRAAHVEIWFQEKNGWMLLRITDDGRGFDPDAISAGNGIKNLRLRAAQLGGTVEIARGKESGAVITVFVKVT